MLWSMLVYTVVGFLIHHSNDKKEKESSYLEQIGRTDFIYRLYH